MPGSAERCRPVCSTRLSYKRAHVSPTWLPRSSTRCSTPAQDSSRDVARPAGPAPTTMTSCDRSASRDERDPRWSARVLRYSMSARRLSSVRIRGQTSCLPFPAPVRGIEPVAVVAEAPHERGRRRAGHAPGRQRAPARRAPGRNVSLPARQTSSAVRRLDRADDTASARSRCADTDSSPRHRSTVSRRNRDS